MGAQDLTTLEKVRTQLALDSAGADAILAGLVTSSSAWVRSKVGRPVPSAPYTHTFNGDGKQRLLLPMWPVSSVTSVTVDGEIIPPRPAVTALAPDPDGWVLRDDGVDLLGYLFSRGTQNVVVAYEGGYLAAGEPATVPSTSPYTVQAGQMFKGDRGVRFAGGAALAAVASSPAAGQYSVTSSGLYTFAAVDAGKAVELTYATVPPDLEQAVIEHVALRYKDRGREGLASVSGGGESIGFTSAPGALAFIEGVIDRFRTPGVA